MAQIKLSTLIHAGREVCFDLARSVEVHLESTAHTREKVVSGRASGLCEAGDRITWEARHFGIRQRLTVEITRMDRPYFFEDRMVSGAFRSFTHEHIFTMEGAATRMEDIFTFHAPLGLLGRLAEALFLEKYMTELLCKRNEVIRRIAENTNRLKD